MVVLIPETVLSLLDFLDVSALVVVAPSDVARREILGFLFLFKFKICNFFLVSHQLRILLCQLLPLHFSLASPILLIQKRSVPISLQQLRIFFLFLPVLHLALVVVLSHLLFGHDADLVLLLKVRIHVLHVFFLPRFDVPVHHFPLLFLRLLLEVLLLPFVQNCVVQVLVVVLHVQLFLKSFFVLLAFVNFLAVLLDGAPFVKIALHRRRVVAFLLIEELLNSVGFLFEGVLDSIGHLEGVHHGVGAFVVRHSLK